MELWLPARHPDKRTKLSGLLLSYFSLLALLISSNNIFFGVFDASAFLNIRIPVSQLARQELLIFECEVRRVLVGGCQAGRLCSFT